MAFSLSLWPNSHILVVRGTGSGSMAEAREILDAIEQQALVSEPTAVLFDIRLLEFVPSAEEARQIAVSYGAFGVRHRLRMAYLAPAGAQYGVARMVQMLSEAQGAAAAVFTSQEAAITWLSSDLHAMGA
jgi:hypothetical protein